MSAEAAGGPDGALALRQEYNAVSAQIDSLVRAMGEMDAEALDAKQLPKGKAGGLLPEGLEVVLIFWADDEARVWINGYPAGETRLSPVEITVPQLYLRERNRIRARCWDTDWVESGFLCGLYVKDRAGNLHPVVVSDESWRTGEAPAQEIAYAHPVPDIPGAQVIWGERIFGAIQLEGGFDRQAILQAASKAPSGPGSRPDVRESRMDYHAFVQSLALLQERRDALKRTLQERGGPAPDLPVYAVPGRRSLSLTLGKAGPLQEAVSAPLAEQVQAWAQELPEEQKQLIYPERRKLKGEDAANPASQEAAPSAGNGGDRQLAYRPPDERKTARPGEERAGKPGGGRPGTGTEGEGGAGAPGAAGRRGGGRASRLGLLLPTLILGIYTGYAVSRWRDLTGGEAR